MNNVMHNSNTRERKLGLVLQRRKEKTEIKDNWVRDVVGKKPNKKPHGDTS